MSLEPQSSSYPIPTCPSHLHSFTFSHSILFIKMGFKRFVEVGRVALINYGPDEGKLAVIIDIVDQNKCLVDGPSSGVARQVIPYKRSHERSGLR